MFHDCPRIRLLPIDTYHMILVIKWRAYLVEVDILYKTQQKNPLLHNRKGKNGCVYLNADAAILIYVCLLPLTVIERV
jgi:hypothetical protein